MKRSRKKYPRPTWLKDLPPGIVGHGPARLYFFLCAGGPNTCRLWNFRIAREFHVSRRTIQFWLQRLEQLGLMTIEKRQSPYRSLHPVYFTNSADFIKAAQRKKIQGYISKIGSKKRVSTAQLLAQRNVEDTSYLLLTSKKDASKLALSDLERNKSSQTLQKARERSQGIRFKNKGKWIAEQMKIIEALEAIEKRYK